MNILICQFGNETNTFKMGLNTFEQLAPRGLGKSRDCAGYLHRRLHLRGRHPLGHWGRPDGRGLRCLRHGPHLPDMTRYSIVGLKSMNHFRGFYTSHSDAIVTADTPGMRPSNLRLTPYRHVLYLSAG